MSRSPSSNELIPSARRMVTSLRDLGYDFSAAVADVVDNSIEAGATNVNITVEFDGADSWVCIADDGSGMSLPTLTNAMRYGSMRDYEEDALGKFGLGLKTASLSQCQRLTVGSRNQSGRLAVRCWDLEHIQTTDRWEVLSLSGKEVPPAIQRAMGKSCGTAVLWECMDRVLDYSNPSGEFARRRLFQMCRDLEAHLSMVFHRFLAGEVKKRRLKLSLNGNLIEAWDPFARDEKHATAFKPVKIVLEQDGARGEVVLQPYVLPHQDRFSSPQAHATLAGPKKWNRQQGFYIYRADRMIQSGGWCNLRTLDEHTKLARIALSFSPTFDEVFKINVAKMRVQLPASIRDRIEAALVPVMRAAQNEYRRSGSGTLPRPQVPPASTPLPFPAPTPEPPAPASTGGAMALTPREYGAETGAPPPPASITTSTFRLETTEEEARPYDEDDITRWCTRLMAVARENEKVVLLSVFERAGVEVQNGLVIRTSTDNNGRQEIES